MLVSIGPVVKIYNPKLLNWTQDLPGRFYGITVKESDGSPAYKNINTINFDSSSFYISQNSPNTDEALISFRGSSGSTTTASNLGSGTGVFAQKSGDDLQFKSLVRGAGIKLSSSSSEVTVESTVEGFYGISVKQSNNLRKYKNINTVNVDATYFYIDQTSPNTDEVLISFRPFWPPPTLVAQNSADQSITAASGRTDLTSLTGQTLPTTVSVNTRRFRVNGLVAIQNTSASTGTFFIELYNGTNGTKADSQIKNYVCSLPASGQLTLPIGPFDFTPTNSTFTKVGLVANFTQNGTVFGLAPNTSTLFVELLP